MSDTKFICRNCKKSKPTVDENGHFIEWQFCCGEAMSMGVVIGRLVPKESEIEQLARKAATSGSHIDLHKYLEARRNAR